MADVAGDLLSRRAEAGDGVGDDEVDLAGVGLGGDGIAAREAKLGAEELVELVALGRVALEDLKEGCLCTGGTLGAAELELVTGHLDAVEVHHEVLRPLGSPLAHCDELSGLEVGVGEGGLGCGTNTAACQSNVQPGGREDESRRERSHTST